MEHELPFDRRAREFVDLVKRNRVVILTGETGSGKSTMGPLALLQAGAAQHGRIVVTESRRILARKLAMRVADLCGCKVSAEVGYQIGQDHKVSQETKLVFMTEQVLLNQLHRDRDLKQYSVIAVDDFHDRGVHTDVLLATLKDLLTRREDLHAVLVSATMDVERISLFFDGAPCMNVDGRVFPVEIIHHDYDYRSVDETIFGAIDRVHYLLKTTPTGDIIVFLPDKDSIDFCIEWFEEKILPGTDLIDVVALLPLHGQQDDEDQNKTLAFNKRRRVIFSTNVAETGITVEGLVYGVDTGLIKQETRGEATMSDLTITGHSQAGCKQRAGRLGRTESGVMYRLYTQENHDERPEFTEPEILRKALTETYLDLRCLGLSVDEILAIKFLDAPEPSQWRDADRQLRLYGAITVDGDVDEIGIKMNKLRIGTLPAKMILAGIHYGCLDPVVTIAAAFEGTKQLFVTPGGDLREIARASHRQFQVRDSDPLTYLKVYAEWLKNNESRQWARDHFLSSRALEEITRIRNALNNTLEDHGLWVKTTTFDLEVIKKAIAAALIVNIAVRTYGEFNWKGQIVYPHPGSATADTLEKYAVCARVVKSGKKGRERPYMRGVQIIPAEWISELVPEAVRERGYKVEFDNSTMDVRFTCFTTFDGTILKSEVVDAWPEEALPSVAASFAAVVVEREQSRYSVHVDQGKMYRVYEHGLRLLNIDLTYGHPRIKLLRETFAKCVLRQLAGITNVEQFKAASFTVALEDLLTPEEIAQHTERIVAEAQAREECEAVERLYEERRRVAQEIETARRKADFEAKEIVRQPLREEVAQLDQRLKALGIVFETSFRTGSDYEVQGRARRSLSAMSSLYRLDELPSFVAAYRSVVERVERESAEKLAFTNQAYEQVLAVMPLCPMCGAAWDDRWHCQNTHQSTRLVPIPQRSQTPGVIGRFLTNRDERFAELAITDQGAVRLVLAVGPAQAWGGKTFTSICYHADQEILPETLGTDALEIREFLDELEAKREALRQIAEEIDQMRRAAQAGSVAVLVFTHVTAAGFVTAMHEGVIYTIEYETGRIYPNVGERWICRLESKKMRGGTTSTAFALKKLELTKADVDAFAREIAETYQGIPPTLLQLSQ